MAQAKSWRIALAFMAALAMAPPAQAERPPNYYTQADIDEYHSRCAAELSRAQQAYSYMTPEWIDYTSDNEREGLVTLLFIQNRMSADELERFRGGGRGPTIGSVYICASRVRAEQLRRPIPERAPPQVTGGVSGATEQRPAQRAEDPYTRAQRTEEDRLEAERRRARARAANVQVRITQTAGNAASCVRVTPRWNNSIHESDPNPIYWTAATDYFVTNTCGYPIYARITARLTTEDISFWGGIEGPTGAGFTHYPFPEWDKPFPQNLGFAPATVMFATGMFAGETFSGSRWQQPAANAQDIILLVIACAPVVRYENGVAITQTMLRNSSLDVVPTDVACVDHPDFTARPPPDATLLSLFRIGGTATPPGEDVRLTRCLNRNGVLPAAEAEASCGALASAQVLPAPLRALGSFNQGLARLRAGDVHESIRLTQAAIETNPTADAYVNLASANYRLTFRDPRRTDGPQIEDIAAIDAAYVRAIEAYDRALQLDPSHPSAARMRAFVQQAHADSLFVASEQRRRRAEWLLPGEIAQVRQACAEVRPEEQEDAALERARLTRLGDLNRSSVELRREAGGYMARIGFTSAQRAEYRYLGCLLRERGYQIDNRLHREAAMLTAIGAPPLAGPNTAGLPNFIKIAVVFAISLTAFLAIMLLWRPFTRDENAEEDQIEWAEDKDTPAAPHEATMFGLTLSLFTLPFTTAVVLTSESLFHAFAFGGYAPSALAWIGVPLSAFIAGWIAYKWIAGHPKDMGFFKGSWLAFVAGLLGLAGLALLALAWWPVLVFEGGEGFAGWEAQVAALLLLAGSVGGFIMARLWLPFFLGMTRKAVRNPTTRRFVWASALVLPLALTAAFGFLRSDEFAARRAQWAIEDYAPNGDFTTPAPAAPAPVYDDALAPRAIDIPPPAPPN